MADWNPSLYLQFGAERTRPAAELLARIAHHPATLAVDLGCGPGNSTALLRDAWPDATIIGVDNSPAMLEEASRRLPDCRFVEADITTFRPERPADVIYANASLQWLTDHQRLFPYLVSNLAKNGVLAVQMPVNWQEPSHVLMRQVAEELGHPASGRQPLPDVSEYYDMLTPAAARWISGAPPTITRWHRTRPLLNGYSQRACDRFYNRLMNSSARRFSDAIWSG